MWDERKKGLEEDYFNRKDRELMEQMCQRFAAKREERQQEAAFPCCPKCGEELEEIFFAASRSIAVLDALEYGLIRGR
jgi:hypothetical protein